MWELVSVVLVNLVGAKIWLVGSNATIWDLDTKRIVRGHELIWATALNVIGLLWWSAAFAAAVIVVS